MFPLPTCPLAGQAELWQNRVCGSIWHLLVDLADLTRLWQWTPFPSSYALSTIRWGATDVLDRAIYEEILTREGRIYRYCEHRLKMALAEARGRTTLRSVLLVLAEEGNANLSQISAQLKRAPGEVHSYLKRLANIDLVGREGRRYYITDPIIALWIKFTILERTPEYGGYKDAIRRYQDRLAEQTA